MKKDLQDKLFSEYPKIFKQKDLSPQETAMCWGIACGDGWFDLIDTLCKSIRHHIKYSKKEISFEATQVKEKWGGLRFYYDGGDDYIEGMVDLAESLSYKICDVCGNPGKPSNKGWIAVRCEEHKEVIRAISEK